MFTGIPAGLAIGNYLVPLACSPISAIERIASLCVKVVFRWSLVEYVFKPMERR
jgi:hypothetical protein